MAYNPFDFFRRNQKTLFAVVTAFVMIMFVLSFGQGDFFQTIPRWLGNQRGQGDVIATVDGRKLYASQIESHKPNRILANQFMGLANQAAAAGIAKDLQNGIGTAGERTKAVVEQMLQTRGFNYLDFQTIMFLQQRQQQLTPELMATIQEGAIQQLEDRLQAVLADPTTSKDDQNTAKAARSLLRLDQVRAALAGGRNYFANMPLTDRDRELFEFDLWLRKADQLGIRMTVEESKRQFLDEFDNRIRNEDLLEIEKSLGDRPEYTRDGLFAALADEFRVRACQAAVLGTGPGRQAFITPYEGYRYYKEQVEPGTYAVLAVPAENYLDKVTAPPTDSELRDLFAKGKDVEPNPSSEKPGFKKPRELKVSWAEVKGDEPFYTQAAADALTAAEAHAKLAWAVVGPVVGPAGFHPLTAPVLADLPDPALQAAYDQYRNDNGFRVNLAWSWSPFGGTQEVVDTSVVKPTNLVSAAGAAAGSALTFGSPFTSLLVLSERAKAEDRNDRARAVVSLLSPATAAGGNVLGNVSAAAARLPAPLPLPVVRNDLLERVRKALAARVTTEDVNRFLQEANRLAAKKDKAEARAAIDRFVTERGLKTGGSTQPHTIYTVAQDAGLTPLKAKMDRGHFGGQESDPTGTAFGIPFFFERDPNSQTPRPMPAKAMWAPRTYPGGATSFALRGDEAEFLFWRTDEIPAVTPKNLDEVRPKVTAAWQRLRARELARKAADELMTSITSALAQEPGGTQPGVVDRVVRDQHTKYAAALGTAEQANRANYFLIQKVAPLPDTPASTGFPGQERLEPFQVLPSPNIKYPDVAGMTTDLLKHKDEAFGTTLVLPDAPRDTYYVAVLTGRGERSSQDFYSKVYAQAFPSELSGALRQQEQGQAAYQARQQAVALLMAEFKVANVSDKLDKGGSGDGD